MTTRCLVADIGGTNARFGLAVYDKPGLVIEYRKSFRAEDFDSVRDAAIAYLEETRAKPDHACFAVAGPVAGAEITFTNSDWSLHIEETRKGLALKSLEVINDFEALAAGLRHLPGSSFMSILPGAGDFTKPVLVIGPGTGLGQALIIPAEDHREIIVPTEGGHVAFAPQTEAETGVMTFIARDHPRVSVERLLSGHGLANIYRALCALSDTQGPILEADEITAAALAGDAPLAAQAVQVFLAILGSVTGDAVLATGAKGGVVLGGGILPKICKLIPDSEFRARFIGKGRMQPYLEDVPVRLLTLDSAALYGAAAILKNRLTP